VNEPRVRFINHACYVIENNEESVIFDPWFEGKVFNDSWSLLKDTKDIDYNKIKFIVITHEHPDHLHWPTLRKISNLSDNTINVLVPQRKNKNIVNNLKKFGFKCAEIPPNQEFKLNSFLSISNYPTGHDSAYVFKVGNKVYLNQNDCQLSKDQCFIIKNKYPKIDYWLMQFSLAGYYANKDNHRGLNDAKVFHKKMLKQYYDIFRPASVIPFASFIYFCKEHNCFLNNWIITIEEIVNDLKQLPWQILFYDDCILSDNFQNRNLINVELWKQVFNSKKKILKHKSKSNDEIVEEANKLIQFAKKHSNFLPSEVCFSFYDKDLFFKLDISKQKAEFVDKAQVSPEKHAGILHSEDFLFFLKFPWGADTLNITSCFEIKQKNLWRKILSFKDQLYER
jgi:UDP-MurNAc hydroxylase